MKRKQLAFSTNAFKRYSLEDAVKEIARIGYGGVEILCDTPHAYPPEFDNAKARHVAEKISSHSLAISNLNAFTMYGFDGGDVYRPSWIESSEKTRQARLEHTLNCIRLAKMLGAKNLSTEPGGPVPSGASRRELEKLFLAGLKEVAPAAEEANILLLVEPEPALLVENSVQFRQLIGQVHSDFVKLNFDIGHFHCVKEDPAALVRQLADYAAHFHLADISNRIHNHLVPGRGDIDFRPVFSALNEIGYKGYVTVELYPYQDNPVQVAEEAYDYLCKIVDSMP